MVNVPGVTRSVVGIDGILTLEAAVRVWRTCDDALPPQAVSNRIQHKKPVNRVGEREKTRLGDAGGNKGNITCNLLWNVRITLCKLRRWERVVSHCQVYVTTRFLQICDFVAKKGGILLSCIASCVTLSKETKIWDAVLRSITFIHHTPSLIT